MFKKRSKTFYKYLFSYVTIMLWGLSIIGFFVIFYLFPLIKSDIRSSHYSVLEQTASAIDADIQIISRASYQLSYSSENLQSYLLLDDSPTRDLKIINELESYASISSIISEIGLLSPDYDFIYTSSGIYPTELFFKNIYIYPDLEDTASQFCSYTSNTVLPSSYLIPTSLQGNYTLKYLTFINPPYALSNLPNTTLLFWVNENHLTDTLKKITDDSSYVIIYDAQGNVLASSGNLPTAENIESLYQEAQSNNNTTFDNHKTDYHMFTYNSDITDWIYVYGIDNSAAYEGMNIIFMIFSIIMIVALIIGILIIWYYMAINYVPLKLLKNITDKLTDGTSVANSDIASSNDAIDEISSLSSALTYLSNRKKSELDMIKDSDLMQSLKATLLFSLLKGHITTIEEFNQNGAPLHMRLDKSNFQVLLVQFNHIPKGNDNSYNILDELLQRTFNEEYQYYFREFFGENQFAVILAFDDEERRNIISRYHALKNAAIENDLVITIGVGQVYRDLSSLPSSSLEASRALHNSFVLGHNSVIIYDEDKFTLLNRKQFYSFDILGIMQAALQKKDYALFIKHAEQIFNNIYEQQVISDYAKNLCYSMTTLLITELSPDALHQNTNTLLLMYQADTLSNYKLHLDEIIKILIEDSAEQQSTQQKDLITQIKEYINQNYDDCNFSVQRVADAFDMNNSYLSLYFKSQTTVNINNYISTLRVQKAKHLLISTNLTLSMISEEVGYYNQNSFIRRFKQITGMTPGDYRKNYDASSTP